MYYVFWLRICLFVSFKRCLNNIFCIGQDRLRWKYHSYFECLWIRYIINVIFYFELFPSIYSLIIFWWLFYFYWTNHFMTIILFLLNYCFYWYIIFACISGITWKYELVTWSSLIKSEEHYRWVNNALF